MAWIIDGDGQAIYDGLLDPITDGLAGTFVTGGFVFTVSAATALWTPGASMDAVFAETASEVIYA